VDYFRKQDSALSLEVVTFSTENPSSIDERPLSDRNRQRALMEAKADLSIILEKISRLKEDFRDVLTLRLVDGLGYGDIARILDKTPGHIRVIYHRAMKALEALDSNSSS
jgi:RNA polymerase sigma factor (sigma-70 family)